MSRPDVKGDGDSLCESRHWATEIHDMVVFPQRMRLPSNRVFGAEEEVPPVDKASDVFVRSCGENDVMSLQC